MRIHISLNVASINNSLDFYSRLFGQEPGKVREDYANFRLDSPPIHLALEQRPPEHGSGVSHLGIELPDHASLHVWQQRLEDSSTAFQPENDAECCYAKADKLWLTDPDGYRWEIWVKTGEHEAKGTTRVADSSLQQACC